MQGFPYLGRLPSYQRAEKNILFAIDEIKKIYPDPDFETVTCSATPKAATSRCISPASILIW